MDAVTLDPWHERGIPLDEQYRSWKQRIKAPYDKHEVDAYTRTRGRVIQPGLKVKEVHAAPIDRRSLSDGAKLPSAQETPASRTSPG